MQAQSSIKVIGSCTGCPTRCGRFFCDLPGGELAAWERIGQTRVYQPGTRLFLAGQSVQGVFLICSGLVKLSVSASNGKSLLRIAEPGEILGLNETLAGRSHEGSAEMLELGQVKSINREQFLAFLRGSREASFRIAAHVSRDYFVVYDQVRSLVLSNSVAEKLARLLLEWCVRHGKKTEQGIHLSLSLTHEEIAQIIGVTRETVTRLLGEFRRAKLVQLKGTRLVIPSQAALEKLISV